MLRANISTPHYGASMLPFVDEHAVSTVKVSGNEPTEDHQRCFQTSPELLFSTVTVQKLRSFEARRKSELAICRCAEIIKLEKMV